MRAIKTFSAAFGLLAMLAPLPVVQAASGDDYTTSIQCASMHIIAGQVLGQDAQKGAMFKDTQADEAAKYIDFAQGVKPGLTEAQLDADLNAQMDKDVALITKPDADIKAFLAGRVPQCEKLKVKF